MSGKPTYVGWIPDNTTNIATPPGGKLTTGWLTNEKPPSQWFNWFFNLASQWINFCGPSAPDVIVGSAAYCTHATLTAAVADSGVGSNINVLVTESLTLASTINLTKSGWKIFFAPGVTYTSGAATTGISMQAANIEVWRARFSGFTTAITCTSAWTYGRVLFTNFATCTTEVDTASAQAGKLPTTLGNITE